MPCSGSSPSPGGTLDALNARRLQLLFAVPATAPDAQGVLVIDEHGYRKWGNHYRPLEQAVAGQHRQDRQRGGERIQPVGRRAGVLPVVVRALHAYSPLRGR